MNDSLIDIKRRIQSINSTKKITKAMKLVASVKFIRWKELFESNKEYTSEMRNVMKKTLLVTQFNKNRLPLALKKFEEAKKTLYIVCSSSLGLCGGYNYNIYKKLKEHIKENDEIIIIGSKAYTHYKHQDYKIHKEYVDLFSTFSYDKVKKFRHFFMKLYKTKEFDSVNIVYTKYINSLSFEASLKKVVPLEFDINLSELSNDNFIVEEEKEGEVIDLLLPQYIDTLIYSILIEASISELASRRNAMENATSNADEINDELSIKYNKARQAQITQELNEVVSGANAQK